MKKKKIPNTEQAIGEFLEWFKQEIINSYYADDPENLQRDSAEYVMLEALNNAWEHGNGKDNSKMISLEWSVNGVYLHVSIADEGSGFTPIIPPEAPPLTEARGRGLFSIKDMVASLTFNEQGNQIIFTFRK